MPEPSLYYQPGLTLPDILYRAAKDHKALFVGYCDKSGEVQKQTYKELLIQANRVATGLYNRGLHQGDKVIIATQFNRETIELLWGCFLLGLVPTILQPPMTFTGYNPSVVKLMSVDEQLGHTQIFMSENVTDFGHFPSRKIGHMSDLDFEGSFPAPVLKPDDLAFIQFSSGSTGDPKGIMLTQQNLVANMDAIRVGLSACFPDNIGNWMPLFHDMGLIGYHLTPIYCSINQYHVETNDFIMNPGLWLDLISKCRINITGCPNFGLALVLRYLHRRKTSAEWDLSCVKAMLNGAEPISVRIMNEFTDLLSPFGFHPDAMMPVYGMAEATLAISFTPLMQPSVVTAFHAEKLDRENSAYKLEPGDPNARILAAVGRALNDMEIRIVDDFDMTLPEGCSGHIQLKGPNVTIGYYNRPEETHATFCGEWLRTGDMGFFVGSELYVCGRYKDIIFKNGRNYFANDLETISYSLEEISYGKVCFGGITDRDTGQEKVIAFLAGIPETTAKNTLNNLRALLRSHFGITVDELVLIKSNEIPKTSSGKLQRFKMMQQYINGEFDSRKITL
jgi:acyl-CoA synthetase (AMP-forming)/AMP-acid ligase II